jgi:hypothetical protein
VLQVNHIHRTADHVTYADCHALIDQALDGRVAEPPPAITPMSAIPDQLSELQRDATEINRGTGPRSAIHCLSHDVPLREGVGFVRRWWQYYGETALSTDVHRYGENEPVANSTRGD